MIYVLTIILAGQFYQAPVDPISCRVLQAHAPIESDIVRCEWVKYVAA